MNIPAEEFFSKKITNKIVQQVQVSFENGDHFSWTWGHVSQHTCVRPCLCNVNFVLGPLGRNHVYVYITEGINVDNGKERRNVLCFVC